MNIELDGLEEVLQELQKRGASIIDGLEDIALAGAAIMENAVESNAPGSISGAIETETTKKTKSEVKVDIGPNRKKWYARFVEFGTKAHMIPYGVINGKFVKNIRHPGAKARPYMRPAFDTGKDDTITAMGEKTKELSGAE